MILAQSAAVQQFGIGLSYGKCKIKFFLIRYIGSRSGPNNLLAGLHLRAMAPGALQKLEKSEHACGEEHRVQRQRIEHEVCPKGVMDQEFPHPFEDVGRRQEPRGGLQPDR